MYSRVYVEITNICNMNCSFCHGHSRAPKRISEGEFSRILDQLTGRTEYIYFHLMGEPLTHPELPRFLTMAKARGFHTMVTTNGTLLKKRGEDLITAGVHKVSISVHSFEGDDETAQRRYVQELAAFADAASAAGVIICLRLWNKGFDEGRNDRTLQYLQEYFSAPWTENTRGYRIRDRLFLEWGDRFDWPDMSAPDLGESVTCHGLRDQFGILCDGTVVPCCLDSEGSISLGNVFDQDLSEILESSRARAMVHGFSCRKATEQLCRRCGYARRF